MSVVSWNRIRMQITTMFRGLRKAAARQCQVASLLVATIAVPSVVGAQTIASSNFDDGPQGWTFDVAAAWRSTGGNPGGCVENFAEPTNGPAWAMASAHFLGNWSSLNGHGTLRFDHRRVSNGGGSVLSFVPIIIEVSGPAGTATWRSELLPQPGPWRMFEVPIELNSWEVQSSQVWLAILQDVRRVRFFLEQVSNTDSPEDLNLLDNVSLERACTADFNRDGTADFFDYLDFVDAFSLSLPAADFNGDTVIDFFDYLDFVDVFSVGC